MNITAMTLSEQMQLTEQEIKRRKELLRISDEDIILMKSCKPFIEQRIDSIVSEFYSYQLSVPEIDLLIGDAETLHRLKAAMRNYVLELFEGNYGSTYVNKRLRIGMVHNRIGVEPRLYVPTINRLHEILITELNHFIKMTNRHPEETNIKASLRKLLMFDVELVFDTYINSMMSEIRATKEQLNVYAHSLEETVAERTRQLEELSRKDPLTNMLNRRAFVEELDRELVRALRERSALTLAYIDLNEFKIINDKEGHMEGDLILQQVAAVLIRSTRGSDIPCRIGGDEFCVILPNCSAPEAQIIFERMFAEMPVPQTESRAISLSVGIAQAGPDAFPDLDEFIRISDAAMYSAKTKSKESYGNYIVLADAPEAA